MNYRIPKGVFDIAPNDPKDPWKESHLWAFVEEIARIITAEFGYREIRTPLFETTELFTRSIGTGTDIVSKEMYTFHDKADRSLTLRPEGTAPVMRSLIEKRIENGKFFYIAPMFRYERQQAGRYRQHHQLGIEAVGSSSPYQDAEVIDLLANFYKRLGIKETTLHINSIGGAETRKKFRHALKMYLKPHLGELSEDSQARYDTNLLRILDSKDPHDKKVLKSAPSILEFLDDAERTHFDTVCDLLDIPFEINTNLVRGLDYYNSTVFEFTSGALGSQNSIGGGGRYDGLIKQLGGPDTPAFGFGAGLERIIMTMLAQSEHVPAKPTAKLLLIPLGEEAKRKCFDILRSLRKEHLAVEMDFSGKKLKNAMKYADATHVKFVAVIGENELEAGKVDLKEMESGNTESISIDQIGKRLKNV